MVKNTIGNPSMLLDKDYHSFELAQNYRLEHWMNDNQIDVELKRNFRRILNQSITFDSEEFEQGYEWKSEAEFRHGSEISKSCQLAYEINGALISFLSDNYWKKEVIAGIYSYLDETGEFIPASNEPSRRAHAYIWRLPRGSNTSQLAAWYSTSEPADIPNVSDRENTAAFCKKQQAILALQEKENIHSGIDILMCREKAFPNLIFCDNALKQLRTDIGGIESGQVYRRLMELQIMAKEMKGTFDRQKLTHASPESLVTLQMYEEDHTIMLPNGKKQIFSWHVRFTGGYGGRIFFEPAPHESKIYIGHIGKKLPTVKYH